MEKPLFLCFLFFSTFTFSQDTIYLDKNFREITGTTTADFYRVLERTTNNPDAGFERSYWISGQLKIEEFFTSYKERTREGKRKMWREDGSLWVESNYRNNELDGLLISYWEDGQVKRKDHYQSGKLIEGKVWDKTGNEVEWYPMEEKPAFPGGQKALVRYLKQNGKKPEGVAGGRVVVGFVVDVDGSVTDIQIKETTSADLNFTAYQLVANMPAWEPGKQDGEPVRVNYALPLNFK